MLFEVGKLVRQIFTYAHILRGAMKRSCTQNTSSYVNHNLHKNHQSFCVENFFIYCKKHVSCLYAEYTSIDFEKIVVVDVYSLNHDNKSMQL